MWPPKAPASLSRPWAKPLAFGLALLPFGYLLGAAVADGLGANPAEYLLRATGDWTLRMLCLVLAITPLRVGLQWPVLARFRRMLGLFVFFYASLHLLCYAWFDMSFVLADMLRDVIKRPFIWLGFSAFLILMLLAATSPHRLVRWLGAARWRRLHRMVYLAAVLAILHFYWMRIGKNNVAEVLVYALVLSGLLGWRVNHAIRRRLRA